MINIQTESLRLITEYLDSVPNDVLHAENIQHEKNIEPTISEYLESHRQIYEESKL